MTKPAPAHADPNSGLVKNEPAMVGAFSVWLVGNVGLLLINHHLVTGVQWSAASLQVTALVTFVLAAIVGWLLRRVVAPAWKLAESEAARLGVTLPDLGFVGQQGTSALYQSGQPPSDTAPAPAAVTDTSPAPSRTAADILAAADAIYPEQPTTATEPAVAEVAPATA